MIKGMPAYATSAIQNYLDTGNFKDHAKESIPSEMDPKGMMENYRANMDEYIQADNTDIDLDPRPGHLKMDGFFNSTGRFETAEDGTVETFQLIGNDAQSAVIYSRDSGDTLDIVTVSNVEGAEEGVQHMNGENPEKSFMTFGD